jgi:hypothetical protein
VTPAEASKRTQITVNRLGCFPCLLTLVAKLPTHQIRHRHLISFTGLHGRVLAQNPARSFTHPFFSLRLVRQAPLSLYPKPFLFQSTSTLTDALHNAECIYFEGSQSTAASYYLCEYLTQVKYLFRVKSSRGCERLGLPKVVMRPSYANYLCSLATLLTMPYDLSVRKFGNSALNQHGWYAHRAFIPTDTYDMCLFHRNASSS